MDSSDEDSIIPIINQIKEFGTRKSKQCILLETALNAATAKNEEWEKKMQTLEKLWTADKVQIKQLEDERTSLQSSLSASNDQRENLENTLIAARAKNEEFAQEIQTQRQLQAAAELEMKEQGKKYDNLRSLLSAKDYELKNLKSSCDTLNSELNEKKIKNRNLELTLESAADACASKCKEHEDKNKELKTKIETLESLLKTSESKCESLNSSLIEANKTIEGLNIKCNALNSSFLATKAENAELITKCETLEKSLTTAEAKITQLGLQVSESEKSLTTADAKIAQLEQQLSESKKENTTNANLEKKKLIMATLKKVEIKLSKNPLYPMIDRMQQNIEKLDEMTKNSTLYTEHINKVEVCDVSDDDDRSTLSYVSDRRFDDVDVLDGSGENSRADLFQNSSNSDVFMEETVLTMPASSSSTDYDNLESTTRNDRVNLPILVDLDDSSNDSDISLNVCSNVSTMTIGEEHSYSSDKSSRLSKKSLPLSLESNQSAIVDNNSTSTQDKKQTKKLVSFELSEEEGEPECTKVPEIDQSPVLELRPEKLTYEKEVNRLQKTIENLIKKTSQNIKLLNPVVLLERCKDDDEDNRPDVDPNDSTESESESSPSLSKKKLEKRNDPLIWTCNICKFKFPSSEALNKHIEFRHEHASICQYCGFHAKTIRSRRRHERLVHLGSGLSKTSSPGGISRGAGTTEED